jgi:hypothetical protein
MRGSFVNINIKPIIITLGLDNSYRANSYVSDYVGSARRSMSLS